SQEYISSARLDAMVAYQPCRKSFARIPATVVIEGYISGPSGSRRYMRPRGVSALREGVVMDPHGGGRRRSIDEHGTPRRARPGRHAAGTRREGTADHIAALPVSRLRAEDDLLGDAPRTTGRAQVPLLELGGGAVVAVDQHRQRSEVMTVARQHVALLALPQEQAAPDLPGQRPGVGELGDLPRRQQIRLRRGLELVEGLRGAQALDLVAVLEGEDLGGPFHVGHAAAAELHVAGGVRVARQPFGLDPGLHAGDLAPRRARQAAAGIAV